MSALARYFHQRGANVSGYDLNVGYVTESLKKEGIVISHRDDVSILPQDAEMVVYTPAIPKNNNIFRHYSQSGISMIKRAEMLGLIAAKTPTIAVAGTHGKTTISSMIAHILKVAGVPSTAFLGGIATNYNTNYLGAINPQWMVAEADEFDRSFLHLKPQIGVISSLDADHLDIYGQHEKLRESFAKFAAGIQTGGILIAKKGIAKSLGYTNKQFSYHGSVDADYALSNVRVEDGHYKAGIRGHLQVKDLTMNHPGRHNLENALAAAAVAHQVGIPPDIIASALQSFLGVKRRFEVCYRDGQRIYIDDYAHHPEEIKACVASARELWPQKKITGIFQPHLYSRTRDLAGEFALSLEGLDEIILMDIYPAREEPIEGVNSTMLLEMISNTPAMVCSTEGVIQEIEKRETEVLITMGAGDIDRLASPLASLLKRKAMI